MKYVGNKVSYIRQPLAKRSFISLGLGILCLGLTAASLWLAVANGGDGPAVSGALGFSGIAAALMGLWYTFLSFLEKEKNYILAKIGLGIQGVVVIFWLMIVIVGLG